MWSRCRWEKGGGGAARLVTDGLNLVAGRAGGARIWGGGWRVGQGAKATRLRRGVNAPALARVIGACVSSGPPPSPSNVPRPLIPTPRREDEPRASLDRIFLGRSQRIDSRHNGSSWSPFSAVSGGQCGVARRGTRRTRKNDGS